MINHPSAMGHTEFVGPRAAGRFGLAIMEARAVQAAPRPGRDPARVERRRPVVVRLWLPLSILFVLLAPLALVLALFCYFIPPRLRADPMLSAIAIGRLLLALSGTDIDVNSSHAIVRIKIL